MNFVEDDKVHDLYKEISLLKIAIFEFFFFYISLSLTYQFSTKLHVFVKFGKAHQYPTNYYCFEPQIGTGVLNWDDRTAAR